MGIESEDRDDLSCTHTPCDITEQIDFDFVVIGTGPCALGFVDQTFKNRPDAKILMLEMGGLDQVP